jgi:beta-lactamase class A
MVSTLVTDASEFGRFLPCPTVDDRVCEHPDAVAMTVIDLDTGETAAVNGDVLLPTASAAKAMWVAAAVWDLGIEAVQPLQRSIFEWSDNRAAGRVIDLLGKRCNAGIDRLNTIVTREFGRTDTLIHAWYDCRRARETMPPWGRSYTTTNDLAAFWAQLGDGELLGPAQTATVMEWAAIGRPGTNELLTARLPTGTAISYKTGWKSSAGARISGGFITAPDGSRFVIAIALRAPWETFRRAALNWASYASCVTTFAVMQTAHDCGRAGDPATLTPIDTGPQTPKPPTRHRQLWE